MSRKKNLHRLRQSLGDARRAGQHQRAEATGELRVEKEERNSSEVVAVEVAHEDDADRGGVDRRPLQSDEGRGPAIHESVKPARLDEDRGLQPSTASKSIAASQEPNVNPRAQSGSFSGGSGRKKLKRNPEP